MAQLTQAQKASSTQTEPAIEDDSVETSGSAEVLEETDKLLDEIDEVLEFDIAAFAEAVFGTGETLKELEDAACEISEEYWDVYDTWCDARDMRDYRTADAVVERMEELRQKRAEALKRVRNKRKSMGLSVGCMH